MPAELADEPALADPGVGDDRDDLDRWRRPGALEEPDEGLELQLAAHEQGRLGDQLASCMGDRGERPPRVHRFRPTLEGEVTEVVPLEDARGRLLRGLGNGNTVDRRGRLQAGRDVQGVAGREAFAGVGIEVGPDERLARADADPNVEVEVGGADLLDQPQRRADRSLRVVLVRGRDPEHARRPRRR